MAATYNDLGRYLNTITEPKSFEEIKRDCESMNFGGEIEKFLYQAENGGVISSKNFPIPVTSTVIHDNDHQTNSTQCSLKVYFKRESCQRSESSISTPKVKCRSGSSRVNLPFHSPALLRLPATHKTHTPPTAQSAVSTAKSTEPSAITSPSRSPVSLKKPLCLFDPASVAALATNTDCPKPIDCFVAYSMLERKLDELHGEINLLSVEHKEEELDLYIKTLHEYNEIKDAGQLLLGRLAEAQGMTTTDMYSRFALNVED